MKHIPQVLVCTGIISILHSLLMCYSVPEIEIGSQVISNIDDPTLRAVLMEAHAERWGIFVGLWPVTLLVLSYILDKKDK